MNELAGRPSARRAKAPNAKRAESDPGLDPTDAGRESLEQDVVDANEVVQAYKAMAGLAIRVLGAPITDPAIILAVDSAATRDKLLSTIVEVAVVENERAQRMRQEAEALRSAKVLTVRVPPAPPPTPPPARC